MPDRLESNSLVETGTRRMPKACARDKSGAHTIYRDISELPLSTEQVKPNAI